ncbi:hypothetical protein BC332_13908 [Capsicum chinense]|nr:hypothetical protein BC332_13908 [Capsicum chinense]
MENGSNTVILILYNGRWDVSGKYKNCQSERIIYDSTTKYNGLVKVRASTEYIHIFTDGSKRFTVCLRNRTCSCGRFQLDELPCGHDIAAIQYKTQLLEDYSSAYYSKRNFQDTYAIHVEPLPCESKWKISAHALEDKILPPNAKRQPCRPPSYNRKKAFNEFKYKRSKVTCSKCSTKGPNKTTCRNFPPRK